MYFLESIPVVNTLSVCIEDGEMTQIIWTNNLAVTAFYHPDVPAKALMHATIRVPQITEESVATAKALALSHGYYEEGFDLSRR